MGINPDVVMYSLWSLWLLYWLTAARRVKVSRRRESSAALAGHAVPMTLGILLVALPHLPGGVLEGRFLPLTPGVFWTGVLLTVLGMAVTVSARTLLGRNWSAAVTIKHDHELIRTGPYRWVRHPIYSGLLLALAGSAVARGEWRGLLGVLLVFAALWFKLRREERWLGETFGPAYDQYRAEVAALIPYLL